MKKLLIMILPMIAALLMQSCKGDEGPMGPAGPAGEPGRDGESGGAPCTEYISLDFTVESDNWQLIHGENGTAYYSYAFDNVTELNKDIFWNGIMNVYNIWTDNNATYQSQLPTVRHRKDGDDYFTCTIDYDFGEKSIIFNVTNSDFYIDEKPETMTFRVVAYYSIVE
ncbi:MAG: collagen-like protein [Bacteroidales bacterium]|nr:collagen-like protein [Bacteroidales bacterium]